ncbi:hypothetical protein P5V78_02345 [Mycobacteroides abscessus subsp. abscessus]|uniref:hypothetical protein n=1 Tax=Mycobacteroides abscessus TaxID=36809 RepID=UPI0005E5C1C8|nr:hypothetical protein [Mycobacteroides abscessus]QSM03194.1 hypothetical protein PROPHIGD24-2_69 [Mycobacterium phage prophiGD24-2]QSM03527.1 hypothetical protein PROPHIGD21-3_68 [Mycobacterium phage prophiGD21-3]MBN7399982.1 hypothetical protein [Mycobacteroides abscessus subsp. abscessus]MDB2219598.1 hypothetical protein [Mycobacteroides abscessus subsp. abscessus]MDO2989301.1 hypothetical protein [Mycobacteroides abscessus subsp. massiliense]
MSPTVVKAAALCLAFAGATGVATFVVVTRFAPGERPRDPRITAARGRFGW